MFDELEKYEKNDHFFLKEGDHLSAKSKEVPEMPGVFLVIKLARGRVELVYIGSSDMTNENISKSKLLRTSLVNQQLFFEQKFVEENIDGLDIYWYVTFDNKNKDLPLFVQGQIMQMFYDQNGRMPKWNR